MANFERRLHYRATYDINYDAVIDAGITAEMFTEPLHQKMLTYAASYLKEYRRSPTPRVMKEEFPEFRWRVEVDEALGYCIDKVRKEYALRQHFETSDRLADALQEKDPDRAREVMSAALKALDVTIPTGKTVNVASLLSEYLAIWKGRANSDNGLIGISTGFPTINAATLGLQPSQLVTVVGLAGAGKSTMLMLMAREAQAKGKVPYFMSFEMTEEEQLGRYMAMAINVPYNKLISGQISESEEERYIEEMKKAEALSLFTLCTDIARASTVSGLEAELQRRDLPDVAFIDGAYLMRDEQTKTSGADWQAMTNITRDLKRMAQRLEIPVVISTQALISKTTKARQGRHRRLDMYSAGYSSSFAQDSDVMFALEKDEDEPEERIIRIVKARHAAAHSIKVEWSWRRSNFGDPCGEPEYEVDEDDDDVEA